MTMNPSLDYLLSLPALQTGETNRSAAERLVAGGKGINVSKMLYNLGTDSIIWGFAGGFSGEELCRQLTAAGLRQELIFLHNGNTRINVKLSAGQETEVNAAGPQAEEEALQIFTGGWRRSRRKITWFCRAVCYRACHATATDRSCSSCGEEECIL